MAPQLEETLLLDVRSIQPARLLGMVPHQGAVLGAQFSRDESRILTWSLDDTARLWDARTGQPLGPALEHEGAVNGAQFIRDESCILTWSADYTARLWDPSSGMPIGPALEHRGMVLGAQISRDESRILTWSADHTARLWDAGTGKALEPDDGSPGHGSWCGIQPRREPHPHLE